MRRSVAMAAVWLACVCGLAVAQPEGQGPGTEDLLQEVLEVIERQERGEAPPPVGAEVPAVQPAAPETGEPGMVAPEGVDILDPGPMAIEELLRLQRLQEEVGDEIEGQRGAAEGFMPGGGRGQGVDVESLADEKDVSLEDIGLTDADAFLRVLRERSREALGGVDPDSRGGEAVEPGVVPEAPVVAVPIPEEGEQYDAMQYSTPGAAAAMAARLPQGEGVVVGNVGDPVVLRLPPPGNTNVVQRGVLGYHLPLVGQETMPSRVVGGLYIPQHRAYVVYVEGQWRLTGERVENVAQPRVVVRPAVEEKKPRRGLWRLLFGRRGEE